MNYLKVHTSKAQCGFGVYVTFLLSVTVKTSLLSSWKAYLPSSVTKRPNIKSWNETEQTHGLHKAEILRVSVKFLKKLNYWRNESNISLSAELSLRRPLCPGRHVLPQEGDGAGPAQICSSALPCEPCRYITASCSCRWSHSRIKAAKPTQIMSPTIPKWDRRYKGTCVWGWEVVLISKAVPI